jgi:SAM-dependent methyltransferase
MLECEPGQRVLEVGAGTGYNAALMSQLVGDDGSVTSIDIDPVVTAEAAANLDEAGISGVQVETGDGWLGEPGRTFDREMVTAECWDISPQWVDQLAEGGVLVLPLWIGPGLTLAVALEKRGDILVSRSLAICGFMPLRGPHGGPPRRAVVPTAPWEDGNSLWIAVFDETSDGRREKLEDLLGGVGWTQATPPLFAGWGARLALEMPDSICLFPAVPGLPRSATGLFDPNARSLAVVADGTLYCFGDPSCCERLTAFLSEPNPLDLAELKITAAPHKSFRESASGWARLIRKDFDLVVTEVGQGDTGEG